MPVDISLVQIPSSPASCGSATAIPGCGRGIPAVKEPIDAPATTGIRTKADIGALKFQLVTQIVDGVQRLIHRIDVDELLGICELAEWNGRPFSALMWLEAVGAERKKGQNTELIFGQKTE